MKMPACNAEMTFPMDEPEALVWGLRLAAAALGLATMARFVFGV